MLKWPNYRSNLIEISTRAGTAIKCNLQDRSEHAGASRSLERNWAAQRARHVGAAALTRWGGELRRLAC